MASSETVNSEKQRSAIYFYSGMFAGIGAVVLYFSISDAVRSGIGSGEWAVVIGVIALTVVPFWLCWMTLRHLSIRFSDEGMRLGKRSIDWSDITEVKFTGQPAFFKCVVRSRQNAKITILSVFYRNPLNLIELIREKAPQTANFEYGDK
jgi:hypothetical protein